MITVGWWQKTGARGAVFGSTPHFPWQTSCRPKDPLRITCSPPSVHFDSCPCDEDGVLDDSSGPQNEAPTTLRHDGLSYALVPLHATR
jgi:hypothetical protein